MPDVFGAEVKGMCNGCVIIAALVITFIILEFSTGTLLK